jgi:hypothetical protein
MLPQDNVFWQKISLVQPSPKGIALRGQRSMDSTDGKLANIDSGASGWVRMPIFCDIFLISLKSLCSMRKISGHKANVFTDIDKAFAAFRSDVSSLSDRAPQSTARVLSLC